MQSTQAGASATARPFQLFDTWGHVQSFSCTPAALENALLSAFVYGLPEHHRLTLAQQVQAHPAREAVSGDWRLRREG